MLLRGKHKWASSQVNHVINQTKNGGTLPDGTEHPSYATTFWHKASHTSGPWESISGCQRLAADGAEWLLASGPCCRSHKINPNSRTRIYVPYTSHPCGHSWECPPRFCNPLCRSGLPRKHRHICNNHCCIMMNARVSMGCWLWRLTFFSSFNSWRLNFRAFDRWLLLSGNLVQEFKKIFTFIPCMRPETTSIH